MLYNKYTAAVFDERMARVPHNTALSLFMYHIINIDSVIYCRYPTLQTVVVELGLGDQAVSLHIPKPQKQPPATAPTPTAGAAGGAQSQPMVIAGPKVYSFSKQQQSTSGPGTDNTASNIAAAADSSGLSKGTCILNM